MLVLLSTLLSILECIKFLLPIGEDDSDFFLRLKNSLGSTIERHLLELSADFVSWEEDVNAEFSFECIAITDEVVSGVNVNGLVNGGRHDVKVEVWK